MDHIIHGLFKIKNCNGKKGNLVHGYDPCWKCILCSHLFLSCHLLSLRKKITWSYKSAAEAEVWYEGLNLPRSKLFLLLYLAHIHPDNNLINPFFCILYCLQILYHQSNGAIKSFNFSTKSKTQEYIGNMK